MILSTKTLKKYLIQHFDEETDQWFDVKCSFNGKYNFIVSTYEGNEKKPSTADIEQAKISVQNFSDSMFRVVEKTIVIIEESNKIRVR